MKRRTFIKNTATASVALPVFLYGNKMTAFAQNTLFNGMDEYSDRVLVLIQLNGGNDGLNMVLPLDQYSNLSKARENILIPESKALKLNLYTGLHPALIGIKQQFDEGKVCIIQNVGYPDQNRSHFRSTDIWQSGSGALDVIRSGWLGRYFDMEIPGYPEAYPNSQFPDPFALTIGSIISETCQGVSSNYSLAIEDPNGLSPLLEDDGSVEDPNACFGKELAFVRTSIIQTNAYAEVITQAAEKGKNLVDYPEGNKLAQQLKTIALLISGGLKTKVYVASLGGFDTHANQVLETDTTNGNHAELLAALSEAIDLFQLDLAQQQLEERVIGMTFSEFGRRILSNGANGTDHGSAAPLIVFGKCVNSSIVGSNPVIQQEVDLQEGVAMEFDFRSVYGSILNQWFGVPKPDIHNLLFDSFSEIPVISGCSVVHTTEINGLLTSKWIKVQPNPFSQKCEISFESNGEQARMSVFNSMGSEVKVMADGFLHKGVHRFVFYPDNLPAGNYFVYVRTPSHQETNPVIYLK
ncbi:MAG TPA: hypothetical protein DCX89_03665 [Saprospirales bacterium]|nr:hypothetical protein [Saprospirales bacterium]HRQ28493.1 DUF1501 domain-containing protein [Saprospiraceae bacterium]